MGLSRLDNFLKSTRGNILYVNPNDLDATDSIENQGNSLTRPFKTIQRALVEASRFSYQKGLDNDRFGKTTVLLYPGEHIVDNRPGWIPDGSDNYRLRNGTTSDNFPPFDLTTNFDLDSPNNELYKLNSIYGGVILPRGTSLVGLDLRKTKIRPKYVPSPTNNDIERSCLFRVTGDCYFWQFSMFDANPNGKCYLDYTANEFVPNFSHHKLTCFEYADGVNGVDINDTFLTFKTGRTDLDMYYEKVSLVYGQSSGRAISPDYPSTGLDIQPKIDEYRIVGSTGKSVGISSIVAGDGTTATTTITVTMDSAITGLDVDTPFRVSGITASGYDGQFVVSGRPSSTTVEYIVQDTPSSASPSSTGATLTLSSDTVTSSSPYIFNCSLRSVYGMCGMVADGNKSTGFKSMVVAQFTGIGLQKDDNAFVIYNNDTPRSGAYDDNTAAGNATLSTNSNAVYKPSYKNFHIKVTNNAVIQAVSVFAIGYAQHFVTQNGGDISLTNSNSNFGATALFSDGFKNTAFASDDKGFLTHIIPPKEIALPETAIEFESLDVNKTITHVGVGSTAHLFLYGKTNKDVKPENVIEGYRFGARSREDLKVLVSYAGTVTEYGARVTMQGTDSTEPSGGGAPVFVEQSSSEKTLTVKQSSAGINSIGSYSAGGAENVITFTSPHNFIDGESIRIISDNGRLPDGLTHNTVYHAITSGLTTNTNIKVAKTLDDALNGSAVGINEKGGLLKISSRVSDKNSGDRGHPVQFDGTNSQWYVNVATAATENTIFPRMVGLGSTALGEATSRTYIKRQNDDRDAIDTIYRARYVIPASTSGARPPSNGYIIQSSNATVGLTTTEIQTYFGSGSISNVSEQRNFRFIADATWSSDTVNVDTELPHNLTVGSEVELVNIKSTGNTTGVGNSGFNRTYSVTGISSAKNFSVGLTTDPGTFSNDTSARTTALPYFKQKRYSDTFYVFRSEEAQKYISGEQDGVYYLTLLNSSNSPTVSPFTGQSFSQPVKELYPQVNRDTPVADPGESVSFAVPDLIGNVVVNDVRKSITNETLGKFTKDEGVGIAITNINSVPSSGIAHTINTVIDHGLNRLTKVSIANSGAGYGTGSGGDIYNARLVSIGASVTGSNATVKLTVDDNGGITAVKVMDGGSAYGIGNTMAVVGVGTTTGYSQAVLSVSQVYDNIGDVIRVSGVGSEAYEPYNQLYRITDVAVGGAKSVTVESASTIVSLATTDVGGIGAANASGSFFYETGESIRLNTLSYDKGSGIATVTTHNSHGLKVDHSVELVGFTTDSISYNGNWVVTENLDDLSGGTPSYSFSVQMGVGTSEPTATMDSSQYAYREGYAANMGVITKNDESLNGRMTPVYAGITTVLSGDVINATTTTLNINSLTKLDINIGDYLMVDDEIVRVKTTVADDDTSVSVFRGILGSKATTHSNNATVRKIHANPIELRRHSIIRASGHTFEYVGFGPGNYSTAFPDKQDREITPTEETLAQSTKQDGGMNYYTGMNDKGISYNGNKKLNTLTGQDEIYDTPVQTVQGEDIGNLPALNVTNATESTISRSLKVEGGPDKKVASEFGGPLIVNNKITSTSVKGIEATSFYIQGDATVSRKHTVGVATPALAGNPGDLTYYSDPSEGGYVGWIYTKENAWKRTGAISLASDSDIYVADQIGIGTTTPGDLTLKVGAGASMLAVDGDGVGIGSTANQFSFRVVGHSEFGGSVVATAFTGDGSGLTGISVPQSGWTNYVSGGSSITYNTYQDGKIGIGTSTPSYHGLTIGSASADASVGIGTTNLYVNGSAYFNNELVVKNANVSGIVTAAGIDLQDSDGNITVGVVTATNINVGSSGTEFHVTTSAVAIGTATARAALDIVGHTRMTSYSEHVGELSIVGSAATVYLNEANTFICDATSDVSQFNLVNIPSGASAFTIKVSQDSTGSRAVGIDTFKDASGTVIPVYWPGGVVPVVTTTASKTDIYTFKIFDGENITSSGLYGIIGGQNFS